MPGLIRGVARTAAIAGTATAVSNRVSRRQANKWAEQEQQQQHEAGPAGARAPAARRTVGPTTSRPAQAARRAEGSGVLTDAEFEAQKAKILAG